MSKIMTRAARRLAGLALLFILSVLSAPAFAGTAQAAEAPHSADTLHSSAAEVDPPSETQAFIVGTIALAMILGIAAAVMWYTSRHRRPLK
jgi:hypothetical protein